MKAAMPDKTSGFRTCKGVEVFAAGNHRNKDYSPEKLREVVANFQRLSTGDDATLRPPLVIGHEEQQELLENTGIPAAGWVSAVYLNDDGSKLLGDFDMVAPEVADLIDAKRYRKVSAELYDDFTDQGKHYGCTLRRVALLGGELPQVKKLADIPMTQERFSDAGGSFTRVVTSTGPYRGANGKWYWDGLRKFAEPKRGKVRKFGVGSTLVNAGKRMLGVGKPKVPAVPQAPRITEPPESATMRQAAAPRGSNVPNTRSAAPPAVPRVSLTQPASAAPAPVAAPAVATAATARPVPAAPVPAPVVPAAQSAPATPPPQKQDALARLRQNKQDAQPSPKHKQDELTRLRQDKVGSPKPKQKTQANTTETSVPPAKPTTKAPPEDRATTQMKRSLARDEAAHAIGKRFLTSPRDWEDVLESTVGGATPEMTLGDRELAKNPGLRGKAVVRAKPPVKVVPTPPSEPRRELPRDPSPAAPSESPAKPGLRRPPTAEERAQASQAAIRAHIAERKKLPFLDPRRDYHDREIDKHKAILRGGQAGPSRKTSVPDRRKQRLEKAGRSAAIQQAIGVKPLAKAPSATRPTTAAGHFRTPRGEPAAAAPDANRPGGTGAAFRRQAPAKQPKPAGPDHYQHSLEDRHKHVATARHAAQASRKRLDEAKASGNQNRYKVARLNHNTNVGHLARAYSHLQKHRALLETDKAKADQLHAMSKHANSIADAIKHYHRAKQAGTNTAAANYKNHILAKQAALNGNVQKHAEVQKFATVGRPGPKLPVPEQVPVARKIGRAIGSAARTVSDYLGMGGSKVDRPASPNAPAKTPWKLPRQKAAATPVGPSATKEVPNRAGSKVGQTVAQGKAAGSVSPPLNLMTKQPQTARASSRVPYTPTVDPGAHIQRAASAVHGAIKKADAKVGDFLVNRFAPKTDTSGIGKLPDYNANRGKMLPDADAARSSLGTPADASPPSASPRVRRTSASAFQKPFATEVDPHAAASHYQRAKSKYLATKQMPSGEAKQEAHERHGAQMVGNYAKFLRDKAGQHETGSPSHLLLTTLAGHAARAHRHFQKYHAAKAAGDGVAKAKHSQAFAYHHGQLQRLQKTLPAKFAEVAKFAVVGARRAKRHMLPVPAAPVTAPTPGKREVAPTINRRAGRSVVGTTPSVPIEKPKERVAEKAEQPKSETPKEQPKAASPKTEQPKSVAKPSGDLDRHIANYLKTGVKDHAGRANIAKKIESLGGTVPKHPGTAAPPGAGTKTPQPTEAKPKSAKQPNQQGKGNDPVLGAINDRKVAGHQAVEAKAAWRKQRVEFHKGAIARLQKEHADPKWHPDAPNATYVNGMIHHRDLHFHHAIERHQKHLDALKNSGADAEPEQPLGQFGHLKGAIRNLLGVVKPKSINMTHTLGVTHTPSRLQHLDRVVQHAAGFLHPRGPGGSIKERLETAFSPGGTRTRKIGAALLPGLIKRKMAEKAQKFASVCKAPAPGSPQQSITYHKPGTPKVTMSKPAVKTVAAHMAGNQVGQAARRFADMMPPMPPATTYAEDPKKKA